MFLYRILMLKAFPNLVWYWCGSCCHCSPLISVVMFSPSSSLHSFFYSCKTQIFSVYLYIHYSFSLQLSLCHYSFCAFPHISELSSCSLSHHELVLWDRKTNSNWYSCEKESMPYKTVFSTSQHWYYKTIFLFIAFKLEELFELSNPVFCHHLILDTFVTGIKKKSNGKHFLLTVSSYIFLQNVIGCDLHNHDLT